MVGLEPIAPAKRAADLGGVAAGNQEDWRHARLPERGAPQRGALPPDAVAAMRQFRDQHMTAWLDDLIPALDGLTPRHAATLPPMQRRLDVLLKEIEQSEARLPAGEQIDIHRLRVALGLAVSGED